MFSLLSKPCLLHTSVLNAEQKFEFVVKLKVMPLNETCIKFSGFWMEQEEKTNCRKQLRASTHYVQKRKSFTEVAYLTGIQHVRYHHDEIIIHP